MEAILVHGMGRMPASMMILAARLQNCGIRPRLFAYTAALEDLDRRVSRLAPRRLYRLLTGEMGQLLAAPAFMASLPLPDVPAKIYAGTSGPRGTRSPFREACNDGILTVRETRLPSVPIQAIASLHSFIMNARAVADDISAFTKSLASAGQA